ncbi:MAG: ABC transporter permease [Pseudomonadota bacterium]
MNLYQTIYTLWLREMKHFARSRGRLLGSMALPLLFLLVLGNGMGGYFRYRNDVSYVEFIGPGIVGMAILFSSMFGGLNVLWDKQFGFLKEILVAPVGRTAIMMGKTLGSVTTSLVRAIVFLAALVAMRVVNPDPTGIAISVGFMFLISASFVALGIAMASRMSDPHSFQLIMSFLIMPVFFLSGALFPLDGLPMWLLSLTYANPLTYGIDGMRYALGCPHQFSPLLNAGVLCVFLVITTVSGAYLFKTITV